ncbi:MAG: ComF family protein [Pseudomonadota bacterium]
MAILHQMINFLLPPRCIATGEIVNDQGMVSPTVWRDLNFISDPKCDSCGFPFDFDIEGLNDGHLCASCMKYPPQYNQARAALIYDDASRDIVLGFKHGDQTHAVPTFMPWLLQAGRELLKETDYLVPVPLHPTRLIRRRFNQSALIAKYLSKETGVKTVLNALTRLRATPTQGHLDMKERKKNVRKAFQVAPRYIERLKGKNIILVDDVYTTGATVNECTKELLKCDVNSVSILTLARVVKPEKF